MADCRYYTRCLLVCVGLSLCGISRTGGNDSSNSDLDNASSSNTRRTDFTTPLTTQPVISLIAPTTIDYSVIVTSISPTQTIPNTGSELIDTVSQSVSITPRQTSQPVESQPSSAPESQTVSLTINAPTNQSAVLSESLSSSTAVEVPTPSLTPSFTASQSAQSESVFSTASESIVSTKSKMVFSTGSGNVSSTESLTVPLMPSQGVFSTESKSIFSTESESIFSTESNGVFSTKSERTISAESEIVSLTASQIASLISSQSVLLTQSDSISPTYVLPSSTLTFFTDYLSTPGASSVDGVSTTSLDLNSQITPSSSMIPVTVSPSSTTESQPVPAVSGTGGKIAAGVCVTLIVIIAAVIGVFYYRRCFHARRWSPGPVSFKTWSYSNTSYHDDENMLIMPNMKTEVI